MNNGCKHPKASYSASDACAVSCSTCGKRWSVPEYIARVENPTPDLQRVIEAAREATCDTHNIPACVELGKALYEYDMARGAICPVCDGAGSIDDDECDRGDGPTCTGPCNGTGLVEPVPVSAHDITSKP